VRESVVVRTSVGVIVWADISLSYCSFIQSWLLLWALRQCSKEAIQRTHSALGLRMSLQSDQRHYPMNHQTSYLVLCVGAYMTEYDHYSRLHAFVFKRHYFW